MTTEASLALLALAAVSVIATGAAVFYAWRRD